MGITIGVQFFAKAPIYTGYPANRFVDVVIANRIETMLSNTNKPSSRIMQKADLTDLFGFL